MRYSVFVNKHILGIDVFYLLIVYIDY